MEQRDYILREIEKIGVLLRAICQRLFGGKDNLAITLEQQLEETKGRLLDEIDFNLDHFFSLDEADAKQYISGFVGFNTDNIELLADSLSEIGFTNIIINSKTYLEKALLLYEFCNTKTKTYSEEREMKIERIRKITI